MVLKVVHDAAMAHGSTEQVAATENQPKKKASKPGIRKGTSASRAQTQAASQTTKLKQARQADGSASKQVAVDLILESFK